MNEALYQQHILDHAKHPHNKAQMECPDIEQIAKNVSCGDSYILYLRVKEEVIIDATFSGSGCAISTAAGSLLTEYITGKEISEVKGYTQKDMYNLLKVSISVGREKCALILFWALQEAVNNF